MGQCQWKGAVAIAYMLTVVAELKVVFKLITLGVKFQECAAHSNKSNNSKLTLERNLLIVVKAKKITKCQTQFKRDGHF